MTHNKNLTNQFLEDNDHILAKSVAQILPSKLKYAFSFLGFLVTSLHIYYLSTFVLFLLKDNSLFHLFVQSKMKAYVSFSHGCC